MNWFTPALTLITQCLLLFRSQAGDALTTPGQHLHRLQIASTRFLHKVFWSPPALPPPTPTASCFIGSQKCMFTSGHHLYFAGPTPLLALSLGSTVDVDANGPPVPAPASKALNIYADAFNIPSPQPVDIRVYIGIVVWLLIMVLGFVIVFAGMGSAHARETPKIRRRRSTYTLGTDTRPNGGNDHSFFSAFSRPTAQLPYSDMVYEQAIAAIRVDPTFTVPTYIDDTTRGTVVSISLSTLRRTIRAIQEMERHRRSSIVSRQQEDYSPNPLFFSFAGILQQQQTPSDNLTVDGDTRSGSLCDYHGITNIVSNEDISTNFHCVPLYESAETVSDVDNKFNNEGPIHTPTNALAASALLAIDPALIPLPGDGDDEPNCIVGNTSLSALLKNSDLTNLVGSVPVTISLKDVLSHQDEVNDKQDVLKTRITFAIDSASIPLLEPLDDECAEALDGQYSNARSESGASGATSEVFVHDVNGTSITSTILYTGLSSRSSNSSRGQHSETGSESAVSGATSEVFTAHDNAHSGNETRAIPTGLDTDLSSYTSCPFAAFGEHNHTFEPTLVPLPEPSADELAIDPVDVSLPEDNSGFDSVFDSTVQLSSIAVDTACCAPAVAIRPAFLEEDEDAKLLFAASVPLPEPTADEFAFDDPALPPSEDTSDVIAHHIHYSILLIASACTNQAREEESVGASLNQVFEVSTPSTESAAYAAEVEGPSNDEEGTGDLTAIATVGSLYVDCLTSEFGEDENIVVPIGMSMSIYSCRSPESERSRESFKSMSDNELSMDTIPQKRLDDPFELLATADKEVDEEINEERRSTFKTTPEYDNAIDTSLSVTQMFGASTPPKEVAVDAAEIGGPSKDSEGTGDMAAVPTYHTLHVASLFPEVEEDEHIVIPLGMSMSICSYRSPEQSGEIFKSMPDNSFSIIATPRKGLYDAFELPALAIEEVDAGTNEERHWTIKTLPECDNTIDPILATLPEPSEDELATNSADVHLPEDGSSLEVEELIFDSDVCHSSVSVNIVGPHVPLEEDEDALLHYASSFPLLEPTADEFAISYSVLSPPKGESHIPTDNIRDPSLLIASSRAAQTEEEGIQTPHATSRSLARMFGASTPSIAAAADATEIRRPSNDAEAAGDLTTLPTDHSLDVAGQSCEFEEDEHVVFPLGTSMSISSYGSYDYRAGPSEESFRSTFDDEVSFDATPRGDLDDTFELPAPVDGGNDESVDNKPMPHYRSEPFEPILELISEQDETEQEDEVVEQKEEVVGQQDEMAGQDSVDQWAEIEKQEEEEEMSMLLRDSLQSTKTNLLAILPPEMRTPQKMAAFLRFASKTSEGSSERRPGVNDSANSSSTESTLSPCTPTQGTPDFVSGTTPPDSSPLRSRFFRRESNKASRWISPFKYRSRSHTAQGSQTPSSL
ncbi:hypothetical protein ACEPAF_1044 [Sanghuangporus sanghuang]